jgi:mannonate dehydratase
MTDPIQSKIKLSIYIDPDPSDDDLLFAYQLGMACVYTWLNDDQVNLETITRLRQRVEAAGLQLWMAGNMTLGKNDKIHLALSGRDEAINRFQNFVRVLGQAGIRHTTFTWEPTQVWSSEPGQTRQAETRRVDLDEMLKRPLTHEREYSSEEIWSNFEYFIKKMMPVCEEAQVRLCLHPNDPPSPQPLGGIPCLIHSYEDYKRAFAIANSLWLGMEFCCGCWLEGGTGFGNLFTGIQELTAQGRISIVHFRNISAPLPMFIETFLDNGYMDMYPVMKAFVASGYDGTMILDHTPSFAGKYENAGTPYALGYMRALIERAEVELNHEQVNFTGS